MQPHITPTLARVRAEWHEQCLPARFHLQQQPYCCDVCGERVTNLQQVVYLTFGTKPLRPYRRLEHRGSALPFVAHLDCWNERLHCMAA